jgi:hypothetical protein
VSALLSTLYECKVCVCACALVDVVHVIDMQAMFLEVYGDESMETRKMMIKLDIRCALCWQVSIMKYAHRLFAMHVSRRDCVEHSSSHHVSDMRTA